MTQHRIYAMSFASVYPHYLARVSGGRRTIGRATPPGRAWRAPEDKLRADGGGGEPGARTAPLNLGCVGPAPSTPRFTLRSAGGPPPAAKAGEVVGRRTD